MVLELLVGAALLLVGVPMFTIGVTPFTYKRRGQPFLPYLWRIVLMPIVGFILLIVGIYFLLF